MTFMTPHDIKTYSLIDHVKLCVCIYTYALYAIYTIDLYCVMTHYCIYCHRFKWDQRQRSAGPALQCFVNSVDGVGRLSLTAFS